MKNQVVAISFESLDLVFQLGKSLLKYKLIEASMPKCLNGLNSETHDIYDLQRLAKHNVPQIEELHDAD